MTFERDLPIMTHVPQIAKRLFIGNLLAAMDDEQLTNHKIEIIINVSDTFLKTHHNRRNGRQIYQITYRDSHQLNYKTFKQILDHTVGIIDLHQDQNILIVCNKGVNRSVSLAIGYGILKRGMTFNQVYSHIENQEFHSLTNLKIKNLLKALSSQRMAE